MITVVMEIHLTPDGHAKSAVVHLSRFASDLTQGDGDKHASFAVSTNVNGTLEHEVSSLVEDAANKIWLQFDENLEQKHQREAEAG